MTSLPDLADRRLALGATGRLATLNRAEVLVAADVHVARRLAVLAEETDDDVVLAAALAVRAVRQGSTALDLAGLADTPLTDEGAFEWPEPTAWLAAVAGSRLVAAGALRVDLGLVYLDRYWREEAQVCDDLLRRVARESPEPAGAEAAVLEIFPGAGWEEQRAAALSSARRSTSVLTGGPGTGKTATVAGLLALVARHGQGEPPRIALAAPTGKAAARLQESVRAETSRLPAADRERLGELRATTLHRLLGWKPESSVRFRHDRGNRLPHDVVVVDETSMVSLTMMARLLEAVRLDARLVLVGDADQLASVEAGAVLADVVAGLRQREGEHAPVSSLLTSHRFTGDIAALAQALREGDGDEVVALLRRGEAVELVDPADESAVAGFRALVLERTLAVAEAAEAGDAEAALEALDSHRLLCAHREGPYGVGGWNRAVERMLAERTGVVHYDDWYVGRPVLVTTNDATQGLYNGDVGVTVRDGDRLRVAVRDADGLRLFAPTRLPDVTTLYAMTVHKSQGSQAGEVGVVLPPADSPLLSHELFYTAVTRAERRVRVLGTEESVRAAVSHTVQRASGLAQRLAAAR